MEDYCLISVVVMNDSLFFYHSSCKSFWKPFQVRYLYKNSLLVYLTYIRNLFQKGLIPAYPFEKKKNKDKEIAFDNYLWVRVLTVSKVA